MIYREHYLKKIREFYDSDLIKIITGIRRCGKSVILDQIKEEIEKTTNNVIYLNFEDRKVLTTIQTCDDLLSYVDNNKKEGKCYIFLDEIQVLNNWQEACKTLRLYNNSVFITGSNSKLLSKEFTKELSGRYVSFVIRPFVYEEIQEYCKELNKTCSISDYLIWGGFPKRFEFNSEEAILTYLNDLDNTIVINDLINRYKIKKENLFRSFTNYILRSNSRIFSAKSIHDYIKSKNESCSINTIIKYLDYLEEAYIIEKVKPYSKKAKNELSYYFKVYNIDVSLNSIRCLDNHYDLSHNLENIVCNELIYRGYKLNVFNNNNLEIDFLAKKNNKEYYIQVTYTLALEKAYEREFKAFNNLDNQAQKIIISNDDIDYSTSTVRHIKLKDFLLMEDL